MEQVEVYLGLGTNQGERERNLMQAVTLLDQLLGAAPERLSRILETPSWGFEGPDFLNMCIVYCLPRTGTPEEQAHWILEKAKEVEAAMGRKPAPLRDDAGKRLYEDRIIDIDLLFYGTERVALPDLTVPHPLIAERDFVKIPLKEIAKPALKKAFPEIFM